MFLLDATGSMGDEIGRLKDTIDAVAAQVDGFDSKPDVRFAMTLYRDQGDMFVTSTFDFTSDIGAFRAALTDVVAEGGGDYPEALEEGLASALSEPSWRDPASTLQLVFLVADAPPHIDRQVPVAYPAGRRRGLTWDQGVPHRIVGIRRSSRSGVPRDRCGDRCAVRVLVVWRARCGDRRVDRHCGDRLRGAAGGRARGAPDRRGARRVVGHAGRGPTHHAATNPQGQ